MRPRPPTQVMTLPEALQIARERFEEFRAQKAARPSQDKSILSYFNRRADPSMQFRYAKMLREIDSLRSPQDRQSGVPVISMKPYDIDKEAFGYVLTDAMQKNGFGLLMDHHVPVDITNAAFKTTQELFSMKAEYFDMYAVDKSGQRGVIPYGTEKHRGSVNQNPDMKYSFSYGPHGLSPEHMLQHGIEPNIWPTKPVDFRAKLERFSSELDHVSAKIERALGHGLGVGEHFFTEKLHYGDHVTRTHLYPARAGVPDTGGDGIAEHTDRCFFTLLLTNDEKPTIEMPSRLFVKPDPEDEKTWLRPDMSGGRMVINMGKAFDRVTRGYFPATVHGVNNSPDPLKSRLSAPKFYWMGYNEPIFEIECPAPAFRSAAQKALTEELITKFPAGEATVKHLRLDMSLATMK